MKIKHKKYFADRNLDFVPGPWFRYSIRGQFAEKYCQPDALVWKDKRSLLLLEYKVRHCNDAFEQMQYLYEPILRKAYPDLREIIPIEVCCFYDPDILIDLPYELIFDFSEIRSGGRFALMQRLNR